MTYFTEEIELGAFRMKMKNPEVLRMPKMTAVVFRRKRYTARVGINYGDYASPRPYVTIADDKNISGENGGAANFEKTGGKGKTLRREIIKALKLRYEIDNARVIIEAGIYDAGEFNPDRLNCASVSCLTGASMRTAQKWAHENDLRAELEGTRKTYYWTRADVDRFLQRPHPGNRARKNPPVLRDGYC
jgi:hypothetical protein